MSNHPWFKLYASDVLTDAKLDAIPPEAIGLILKMWCVCHIEGKCSADPKEIARKTRLSLDYVLQCKSHCDSLFKLQDGFYISERMEREKRRSDINRTNANERYKEKTSGICTANRNANGSAIRSQTSDYDSDNDLEPLVLEIAKLHPKIADAFHLSREYAHHILEAIARHGAERVLAGTKVFRECFDRWPREKLEFAPGVQKFFGNSEYLFDANKWEVGGSPKPPALPADISVGRKRAAEFGKTI